MSNKRKHLYQNVIKAIPDDSDSNSSYEDYSDQDSVTDPNYDPFLESDNDESDAQLERMAVMEEEIEAEEDDTENDPQPASAALSPTWSSFSGRQPSFAFIGNEGLRGIDCEPDSFTPEDAFSVFVDDEVLQHLVDQTNIYANQVTTKRTRNDSLTSYARHRKWSATTKDEIKTFLGILLWMGLSRKLTIDSYWSQCPLYKNEIAGKMSRNRFELLLNCIHFSDNEELEDGNRLWKIQPLMDLLLKKYKAVYSPGMDVVIDETIIPWRGRLKFKQYIPNKAHKYGIKLFKLCTTDGFTYNMEIYAGKSDTGVREKGVAKKVCEKLMIGLLNEGRTLYVDNFYTSYELAVSFLQQKTHVVGTLRSSKKNMPKEVMDAKLKKGEMISREDENGIVVLKWRDTRDVRMLSTKHKPVFVEVRRRSRRQSGEEEEEDTEIDVDVPGPSNAPVTGSRNRRRCSTSTRKKPEAVVAYNKGKTGIDLSDQMASYATTLRKGVKWYRKLGIELLLGLTVVNARLIFQKVKGKKIKMKPFREAIALSLLDCKTTEKYKRPRVSQGQDHVLEPLINEQNNKEIFRTCKICYQTISAQQGRDVARRKNPKSKYYCPACPGKPAMCVPCFTKLHK